MQDDIILSKLLEKDEEVFEEVIERYHKLLWLIAENILGKIGTAEDIEECISDVFVRLWQKPDAFDPERGTIKTYLCIMTRSMALNYSKKLSKERTVEFSEVSLPDEVDLFTQLGQKEKSREVFEAICNLKEPHKEVLIRRFYFEEKPAVIAGKMRMEVKKIENMLYQSKKRLRDVLQGGEVI